MDDAFLWLGDKLPTIADACYTIYHYSKKSTGKNRLAVINKYAKSLEFVWQTAFGKEHVLSINSIKARLEKIMSDYTKKVIAGGREYAGRKKIPLRLRNKEWQQSFVPANKHSSKKDLAPRNCDMLDIGKNMNEIDPYSDEAKFYDDQKGARIARISNEVDFEYEKMKSAEAQCEESRNNDFQMEIDYVFHNTDGETEEVISTTPKREKPCSTCSKRSAIIKHDKDTQIDFNPTPEIRKLRNTTDHIKDTIATVSSKGAISVPKARVVTEVVCAKLYGHKYELEATDEIRHEDVIDEPLNKKPRSAADYEKYKNVLPSAKVVATYKHKKALSQEITATKLIIAKKDDCKLVLHYDSTSRSRIDGEWPSLILNFNGPMPEHCHMIPLRPIFFAYEDRVQIVNLIVETLKRLSATTGDKFTINDIWKKIDALMTDAASKNLDIGIAVAKAIISTHVPHHLLCKSHTCERLDQDNMLALSQMESKIDLRKQLISREPMLKSFIQNTKCVTESALTALLKLVAVESDGKTVSLRAEFDQVLESAGAHKSLSLYKEKRFTKLGYLAGAVYDCIPYFKQILDETPLNNLLIRACKLYIENPFILSSFKALANFTYHVTMPYLNCIERCDQEYLCSLLPNLYTDLSQGRMDTLQAFHVPWTHINMNENRPITEFDNFLLKQLCHAAAKGVKLQCSREYWDEQSSHIRATQLHKLNPAQRSFLPTNNLVTERSLAKFGYLASMSAKRSNRFFKAKRIRDDMMFAKTTDGEVEKEVQKIMKVLDNMEISWTNEQKSMKIIKLKKNIEKKQRANDFVDNLLVKCKEHGGPVTNIEEIHKIAANKSYLRQELQYQRITHSKDAIERKDLYKVNGLTSDEMAENLVTLLSQDAHADDEPTIFMCEDEIMVTLMDKESESSGPVFAPQQCLAIVWDDPGGSRRWYIGFYQYAGANNCNDSFIVDHLERKGNSNSIWQRPSIDDIQEVSSCQIIPCDVNGEWDFSGRRPQFIVQNWPEIENIANID